MNLFRLALAWAAYALLHSALAALAFKGWVAQRWPGTVPYYRLAFNIVAVVTLVPILWLSASIGGDWLWRWTGYWAWLADGLALAAIFGFLASARYYDMDEFLGLRQLREHTSAVADRSGFVVSPLHRYVRHPWYCFGLVLIWSRDMNAPGLLSALAITLYLAVGSRLEERKLLAQYGATYRRYMRRVPALLPLPWKTLSREEAQGISAP